MKNNEKTRWITETALLCALLLVLQAATTPLGMPLLTGSIVNFLLVISVMACGMASGMAVAVISPVAAKFLGIGPLWSLIPFIIAGNTVLVVIWRLLGRSSKGRPLSLIPALVSAAVSKSLVLYVGIVKLAVPYLLKLPAQQAAVISSMFSFSQLVTALAGGGLAMLILPALGNALKNREH